MLLIAVFLSVALLVVVIPILLAKSKPGIAPFLCTLLAIAFILGVSSLSYTKTDDEYITFRVVDNFVNGKGLTYNPGEKYEAITNIGWSIFLSLLPLAGLSLEIGSRWLSLGAALFCLWGVSRLADNLGGKKAGIIAPFLMLFVPFFHYWSTSGLETMAFCALCAWSLALATTTHRFPYYAVIAGVSSWLRPEAPLIFIACFLLNLWNVDKSKRIASSITALIMFIMLLGSLYIFRYLSYGTLQAPTAASKIPMDFSNLKDGFNVLATSLTFSPILFLGLFICLPLLSSKRILILFILSLCGIGYYTWLGFDTMKQERLLAPFIPALIALLAIGLASWKLSLSSNLQNYVKRLSIGLAAGLLIFSPYFLALGNAKIINAGLENGHRQVADYLVTNGSAEDCIAVQDAGVIGYFWHGKIIDLSGIFDPSIIAIHKAYGRVSNNSQQLPPNQLAEMNRKIADYILEEVKPRFIILVYTFSADGEIVPSKHNHNLGDDERFVSNYTHRKNYYYSPIYVLKLYEVTNSKTIPSFNGHIQATNL